MCIRDSLVGITLCQDLEPCFTALRNLAKMQFKNETKIAYEEIDKWIELHNKTGLAYIDTIKTCKPLWNWYVENSDQFAISKINDIFLQFKTFPREPRYFHQQLGYKRRPEDRVELVHRCLLVITGYIYGIGYSLNQANLIGFYGVTQSQECSKRVEQAEAKNKNTCAEKFEDAISNLLFCRAQKKSNNPFAQFIAKAKLRHKITYVPF
eukprot:TRINITY_DN5695_c0_g1_i1.p1 TRINITY_DN5695_c0_g1~~TRINITY_DN5695_c0_g1_i1.p1  ORF type:complete len:225 (-),score=61.88 TRINITY_DN5695_c0_g1_i1:168-794(-)